mgnify:CR=1 FL=1|tara:strand:- start:12365 stop:13033 length:669 start_codon:yes stop_codon:yes gene_type:complete
MKLDIHKFEKDLKISIKDKSLLIEAFTHKSSNKNRNNEKLEFLGDRVIGLVLSKKLFDMYPNESVGSLDKRFAALVNKKTCCSIAWSINLQKYIMLADSKKKITLKDQKILSDTCEALIGAIFIDKGLNFVSNLILKLWKKNLENSNVTILDPKTKLQEYSLGVNKKLPFYKIISSSGPKHNPRFKISVSIIGSKTFYGYGRSKQDAQQDAAKNLLNQIGNN